MTDNQIEEFSFSNFFPYLVRIYYRSVTDKVRTSIEKSHGLTANEWRVMALVNEFKYISAKEIVKRSSMSKVNVSRGVSELEKRQFIDRHVNPTDRRSVLLCFTPKAKKVMTELIPIVLDVEKQILKGLSEDDQENLIRLMTKVRRNALAIEIENSE